MVDTSQPRSTQIILVAIFSCVLLFFLSVGLIYMFQRVTQSQIHQKVELAPAVDLQNMRNYEAEQLHSYAYVNRDQRVVRIPIERAIELEARRPWRLDAHLTTATAPLTQANDGGTTHGK